ncbi:MAG: hypothetical protein GY711_24240 [bacterium]|nr:hypothetical protein [bacterium]
MTNPGGAIYDGFGLAVAALGDLVAVGAPFNDVLGGASGAAYVYERQGTHWRVAGKLAASDAASAVLFGWSAAVVGLLRGDAGAGVRISGQRLRVALLRSDARDDLLWPGDSEQYGAADLDRRPRLTRGRRERLRDPAGSSGRARRRPDGAARHPRPSGACGRDVALPVLASRRRDEQLLARTSGRVSLGPTPRDVPTRKTQTMWAARARTR